MLLKIVTGYLVLCLLIFLWCLKDVFRTDPKFGPNYLSGMYWILVFVTAMPVINIYMLTMIILSIPSDFRRWIRRTVFNVKYSHNSKTYELKNVNSRVNLIGQFLAVTRCMNCNHLETIGTVNDWWTPEGTYRCTSCGDECHDQSSWLSKNNWVSVISKEVSKMSSKDCLRFLFNYYIKKQS